MKKNVLHHFIVVHLKSIEMQIYDYQKDNNPESLHRIRVDIKKIRAINSFAKKVYKQKYPTSILKPIFGKAGKIREIKINIQLLGTIPHLPKKLITNFKKNEKILEQQFIKNRPLYLRNLKKFHEEISIPEKLPAKKTIKRYFEKEQRKAIKKLQKNDWENMHQFRKKIKKMMYIYTALPKKMQKEIKFNKGRFDDFQKQIGKWHDTFSAITFLSNQKVSENINEYILKLNRKESREFNTLLQHLKTES